ncbi:vomeronasal type-1 receptor 4-like [Peromyscus californicus insignis]|uniref:vomeronasal type-1 receptor 4-like n=1 Tax=Peromyscus californicus insignis TaxID=564181 RepID=UPI0022A711FB|nr:vomeronasal type-1 receptor 4-like [Peromyscus californicus insignis]XP_052567818.1 vomeronasal type-1 receptor 4-like [Peromyscus californicus insignis]XP_052567819.1 vomeronasal type-1 receptor 4-like [Peromyscus californicus insignis]
MCSPSLIFPCRILRLRVGTDAMAACELAVGVIFLCLTVIGVLGNFSLLYHYLFLYRIGYKLRSTDWILMHLMVANIFNLLCKGMPQTMSAFGSKDFLNDIGCKLVFSFHRVGRGVGVGSTSFLSVFQAIGIGLRDSRFSDLKVKTHKCICYSVYLSWLLHFLISSVNLVHMRAKHGNESTTNLKSFLYCYWVRHDKTRDILYAILLSAPDILFLGLMLWASSYIVLTLYRHKQMMKQLPRNTASSRSSHESRATKTILLLVSTFVSFYTLSSLCQLFGTLVYKPSWSLVNVTAMASLFFPTVCPFLLLSRDSRMSRFCLPLKSNKHFPNVSDQQLK